MATNPPPDFTPEPVAEEPAPNPWAPLEERGFRPDQYEPDEIVQGAQWYKAFNSRDFRDAALTQAMRHAGFPEDMTASQIRELALQQAQQETEPQYEEYEDQQYMDPAISRLHQEMMALKEETRRDRMEREESIRKAEEMRIQQSYEAEFTREAERVAKSHDFAPEELLWLASEANNLRQSMPYATTAEVMDKAGEKINGALTRRLQAMAAKQQNTTSPGLPPGPTPSDQQVPQNAQEANEAMQRVFTN